LICGIIETYQQREDRNGKLDSGIEGTTQELQVDHTAVEKWKVGEGQKIT